MGTTIRKIGIAGAGTMGYSIAQILARHGYGVFLYDIQPAALEKARQLIALNQAAEVLQGTVTQEESTALQQRIAFGTDWQDFADVDFLIEAIVEKLDIKHGFWSKVSAIAKPEAILVSNTSGLRISDIAEAVQSPERFGGMHWFNPPHIIPLIEVIAGAKTSVATVDAIVALCEKIGKVPVRIQDAPGFAANRIQFAILRECLHILESGIASAEDIDKVMKHGLGLRYAAFGPFEVADLGGLDVFNNIASYLFADLANNKESFGALKRLADDGHYGVKNNQGFYDYGHGRSDEVLRYRDEMYTALARLSARTRS